MHIVGPRIWRETLKTWKMRNAHFMTWKLARKLKNLKNETQQYLTWNMARNTQKRLK